jgi:hypothetical protein
MSDFVTGLRAELVAAAERDERRRLPLLPPLRPLLPAIAVAALAAIAIVVVITRDGDQQQVAKPPHTTKQLFGGTVTAHTRLRTSDFFVPLELTFPDARWLGQLNPSEIVFSRQPKDINVRPDVYLSFFRNGGRVYDPANPKRAIPAPRDVLGFLSAHPDITAEPPRATTLAGHEARVMDYRFSFDRPLHSALYCQGQGFKCTQLGPDGVSHPDGERDRVWEVQTKRGPLYVVLAGWTDAAFAKGMKAAQPVLDSLKIDD